MLLLDTYRGCIIFNPLRFSEAPLHNTRNNSASKRKVSLCLATAALLTLVKSAHGNGLPEVTFDLKPRVCVLSSDEDTCYDQINVSWAADRPMSLCLFDKDLDKPIICWDNKHSGEYTMNIETSDSLSFTLKEVQSNQLLASKTFEVIHDHKQYRRARRNAWAFF